jgi:hypothetical protein
MPDLIELLDSVAADETTTEAPAETPETEAPAAEAADSDTPEPEAPAEAAPAPEAVDLFTDEALATPAGVKAAREALQAERATFRGERDRKFLKLRSWERKLNERTNKFKAIADERAAQYKAEDATLQDIFDNGNADKLLSYLAHRTGREPVKVIEALNMAAMGRKRAPEPDAATKALQARIDKFEAAQAEQAEQAEVQKNDAWVKQRVSEMVELARTVPHAKLLVERSPQAVGAQLAQIKKEAWQATGQAISDQEAVDTLEKNLAALASIVAGHGQTPAKSGKPQTNTSLTARQVASAGTPRNLADMSDDEHTRALANDDEFFDALFG